MSLPYPRGCVLREQKRSSMKLFGKEVPQNVKKDLITRLVLLIVSGTVLLVSLVVSLAWFSSNQTVTNSGMMLAASTDNYLLLVDRRTEYDSVNGELEPNYPGVAEFKSTIGGLDYSLTATSTGVASKVAYELRNEDASNGKYYLRPGSYGTLTFYLKPLKEGDMSVSFSLDLGGFSDTYDNGDNLVVQPVTNATVLNYLKGHILFFTGRTGATYADYAYTGFIDNGAFTYNTSEHSPIVSGDAKNGCYEITLYWEWLMTYDELSDNVGTKYPAAVGTYFNAHKDYFLAKNQSSSDVSELNDGYNDADQIIGDYINYMVAYIYGN